MGEEKQVEEEGEEVSEYTEETEEVIEEKEKEVSKDKGEITTVDVDEESNKNNEQGTEHEEKIVTDDIVQEGLTRERVERTIPIDDITTMLDKPFVENNVFQVTVQNGIGSGLYPSGTRIQISHPSCPEGESFVTWVIRSGNPEISNVNSATTILTTPIHDASVQALCSTH